jgi:hypothetical protein
MIETAPRAIGPLPAFGYIAARPAARPDGKAAP